MIADGSTLRVVNKVVHAVLTYRETINAETRRITIQKRQNKIYLEVIAIQ